MSDIYEHLTTGRRRTMIVAYLTVAVVLLFLGGVSPLFVIPSIVALGCCCFSTISIVEQRTGDFTQLELVKISGASFAIISIIVVVGYMCDIEPVVYIGGVFWFFAFILLAAATCGMILTWARSDDDV